MSDVLYRVLCKKYPPVGPNNFSRVTLYPLNGGEKGIERIHLNLVEKVFLDRKKPLVEPNVVEELAKKIFEDVNHNFYEEQEEGNVIFFRPKEIDEYSQNYTGHYIAVHDPLIIPKITISTGNRGIMKLHKRQRKKYLQFVNDLYGIFLENASAE